MQKYHIVHIPTGEVKNVEGTDLGKAIMDQGWEIADCRCEIITRHVPVPKPAYKRKEKQKKAAVVEEELGPYPPGMNDGETNEEDTGSGLVAEAETMAEEENADRSTTVIEPEIAETPVTAVIGEPSEVEMAAQGHKEQIEAMALQAEVMFIRMGQLLYNAREGGEWIILHYESFKEYVESLSLPMTNSYSWATRLSNIFEYLVKNMGLDEKLLAEIGVAKLTRLLPLARKGELTEAVIEAARVLSDLDLRAELGHDVSDGGEEKEDMIICGRCGFQFDARKAARVR